MRHLRGPNEPARPASRIVTRCHPGAPGEAGGHIELEQTRIEARGDFRISAGPFNRLDFGAQHSDYEHTEFEAGGEAGTRFLSEGWEARGDRLLLYW